MKPELSKIYDAILEGDMPATQAGVQAALAAGLPAEEILQTALIPAMDEVGELFEQEEFFVPEMLVAARAMQSGLSLLKPLLVDADVKPAGRVAIGTVAGDLHDIGKNLVAMMLEGAGFEIMDLGTNVPPDKFVAAVQQDGVGLLAMSALLTTTMPGMKKTIDAIAAAGLRDKVKVMVGGAPVTADYAVEIGADGYAPDAGQAASLARRLVS